MRKNYGYTDDYLGVFGEAEILCPNRKNCVVSPVGLQQKISVTNWSLLTYEIYYKSVCHKDDLFYPQAMSESDDVWEGHFPAPFRWDGRPRTSSVQAMLAARPGQEPAVDRETRVSLDYQPANYRRVGTFEILLQIDTDGTVTQT